MQRVFITCFCPVALLWGTAIAAEPVSAEVREVLAISADSDYGEYLAGECKTCHTAKKTDTGIPDIHSKPASYLIDALIQYRNKTRENETMRSVAGVLNNEEIAALAAYFSALK